MNRLTLLGIGGAIVFALLPFVLSRQLFFGAEQAKTFFLIGSTLAGVLYAAVKLWSSKQTVNYAVHPFLWSLIGLFIVYWGSALFGIFPERSLFADLQRGSGVLFLTHIIALAVLIGTFFSERDWMLVRRTILFSSGVFGLLALLGTEGIGLSGRILWLNLDVNGFSFANSTFAGAYLLLAFIIGLFELSRTTRQSKWFTPMALAVGFIVISPVLLNIGVVWGKVSLASVLETPALLLGSARASSAAMIILAAFLAGWSFFAAYGRSYAKTLTYAWAALVAGSLAIVTVLLFIPGSVVQETYIETSTAARPLVWQSALLAASERPLLGYGPENFEQAFQGHFDNRLFEQENLGEIWFDRAHNVFIDTFVSVGAIGILVFLVLIGAFVFAVYRARTRGVVSEFEALLLFALPVVHLLQLQTAFDTVGSYALLAVFGGYALFLERTAKDTTPHVAWQLTPTHAKVVAALLVLFVVFGGKLVLFDEWQRQSALFNIFVNRNAHTQLALAELATSRVSSFESLRSGAASLLKGALELEGQGMLTDATRSNVLRQIDFYEARYERYIATQPEYYRAKLNLVYLLIIKTALGGEPLDDARTLIAAAYPLSPGNPLTPGFDALVELYSGNLAAAKEKAQDAVRLNPNVPFSNAILAHILRQEATFPTISVMRIENI